jgi:hypothetical protein
MQCADPYVCVLENGPCPLVSICNVLFIRGDLNMHPFEREKVTFEYLLEILGDYLVNHAPSDVKVSTKENKKNSGPLQLLFFFFYPL